MDSFNKICTPAKVYLALAVLFLLSGMGYAKSLSDHITLNQSTIHPILNSLNFQYKAYSGSGIVIQVLSILVWTWILNFICSSGYKNLSWFLVLFPYVLLLITILLIIVMVFKAATSKTIGVAKSVISVPIQALQSVGRSMAPGNVALQMRAGNAN